MIDYIRYVRELVGPRPLILCGANVIIIKDGQILLHHRKDNDAWSLPGGMTELGEKVENTAVREAFEEVGLKCSNLTLFNVYSGEELYYMYPNGDEVYNVTVTFLCNNFSGEIKVDQSEGKDAKFFLLNEIPEKISPPVKLIIDDFIKKTNEGRIKYE
jgi:8-oxo-dGTP pyrophosphatase MutT (NUDIX family)